LPRRLQDHGRHQGTCFQWVRLRQAPIDGLNYASAHFVSHAALQLGRYCVLYSTPHRRERGSGDRVCERDASRSEKAAQPITAFIRPPEPWKDSSCCWSTEIEQRIAVKFHQVLVTSGGGGGHACPANSHNPQLFVPHTATAISVALFCRVLSHGIDGRANCCTSCATELAVTGSNDRRTGQQSVRC
jgi:hypothetical protein